MLPVGGMYKQAGGFSARISQSISRTEFPQSHHQNVRYASMTSAVWDGLKKSQFASHQRGNVAANRLRARENGRARESHPQRSQTDRWAPSRDRSIDLAQKKFNTNKKFLVPPKAIPYTTASSEFIYGASAVQAALRCGRRKLYTLYVYEGAEEDSFSSRSDSRQSLVRSICKFGCLAGAKVKVVQGPWLDMLDRMSGRRPHNGFVLEASPLPRLPVTDYGPVSPSSAHFDVSVAPQSEEEAVVNGTDGHILRRVFSDDLSPVDKPRHPYPFTLLLEGILDPGNIGAIIRTAYYFGADAVATTIRNSAPMSAITIKSSAGAAENIPIFSTQNPAQLIEKSQRNGWQFFAAEAPDVSHKLEKKKGESNPSNPTKPMLQLPDLRSKLNESPCVLMLGSEERGLSKHIREKADAYVGIPGAFTGKKKKEDSAGVDSLNVSVASALLCEAFLGSGSSGASSASNNDNNNSNDTERIF